MAGEAVRLSAGNRAGLIGMFSIALASQIAASSWIDTDSIPQDLIEGVVTTFIGLVILFSIKPRLRIDLHRPDTKPDGKPGPSREPQETSGGDGSGPKEDEPSEIFGFRVTNKRLSRVIEVRARLLRIRRHGQRKTIDLIADELFELRGQRSPLQPSYWSLVRARLARLSLDKSKREEAGATVRELSDTCAGDRDDRAHFTFCPVRGKLEEEIELLGKDDYILFQVIAKNGFTGFSRLARERFDKDRLTAHRDAQPNAAQTGMLSGGDSR